MPYTKALPEWNSGGIKPPQSKLDNGWQVDEKPPAAWWNWFMYTSYQAMQELQQNAVHNEKLGANGGVATLGGDGKLTAAQLPAIGSEQITDGTIANAELASDVKVGSLASLTTMAKASVTGAINEVKQLIDTHSNDSTRHITSQERTTWNGGQLYQLTSPDGSTKTSVTNVNTATTVGVFLVASSVTGAPSTGVGTLYVWKRGTTHLFQEYWEVSTNTRHHRTSLDNGATWQSWQTIANTDVATTSKNGLMSSSDKTALDNAQKVKLTSDGDGAKSIPGSDANNITESGYYVVSVGASNVPEQYGIISHVKRSGTNNIQYFMATGTGNMYVRGGDSSGWRTWRRITDNNILGGILLGNKLVDTQTANFVGKVSGSTTVNPHIAKRASGTSPFTALATPSNTDLLEMTDAMYLQLSSLDASTYTLSFSSINGWMAQHLFSFNLIAHVERTYGTIPGATTADKVAWLKENIKSVTANWHGYGSSPSGSKASFTVWHSGAWVTPTTHSSSFVNRLAIFTNTVNNVASRIGNDGFVHFLAYADPSNGVTSSVLNTDYVELQVELSTSLKDNNKPVWIDATLQNGWVEFDSDRKPRYSIGSDGFVTLKGAVKSGTYGVGTPILTLPTGFRPLSISYSIAVAGANTDKSITVRVNASGQISVIAQGTADNTFVSLDGIRFPTN